MSNKYRAEDIEAYKVIATWFNHFFGTIKPKEKIKRLKRILNNNDFRDNVTNKELKRIWLYHDAWVEFKNKWYQPDYKNFNCPYEWYQKFLETDPNEHLKEVLKYANNIDKAWLKECLKSEYNTEEQIKFVKEQVQNELYNLDADELDEEEAFDIIDDDF